MDLSSRASEARPGTHTPQPIERARRMGPRFRGDDRNACYSAATARAGPLQSVALAPISRTSNGVVW